MTGWRWALGRVCGVVAAASLLMVMAGCTINADVLVALATDGGGDIRVEVEVDAETVAEIGGPEALITEDLASTSWVVSREVAADGSVTVVAEQPFASTDEAADIFAEIGGAGLNGQLVATRSQQDDQDDFRIEAGFDLSAGSQALIDDELIELLGAEFAERATFDPEAGDTVNVTLRAEVPGADAPAVASGVLGVAEPLEVVATGTIVRAEPGLARAEAERLRREADDASQRSTLLTIVGVGGLLVAALLAATRLRKST